MSVSSHAIGIDLGTVNSCVGVFYDGKVHMIPNDEGEFMIPSCVAFNEAERRVGRHAIAQISENRKNTIFDVKRLIGLRYEDKSVQENLESWPFQVIDDSSSLKVQVSFKSKVKTFYPEEISAMILENLKEMAEAHLKKEVKDAVITVPTHFKNCQRQATRDAGAIAGLNVLRITNEPIAATIACGFNQKNDRERFVLVFDLGSGTFSVSILSIDDGNYEVIATDGNAHFGGVNFDKSMALHFMKEFQQKFEIDHAVDDAAFQKLLDACEKAKRQLTTQTKAMIDIDCFYAGRNLNTSITRDQFENLTHSLFEEAVDKVKATLREANLENHDINDVIFVGGASRMPKMQRMIGDLCHHAAVNRTVDPEHAVAYGAAIQAAVLSGEKSLNPCSYLFVDVMSHTMGIEVAGGLMSPFIKQNSCIPSRQSASFTTNFDNQKSLVIKVYEGDYSLTRDNYFLGTFEVLDIPPAPQGVPNISVTFDIDRNGILSVEAHDLTSNTNQKISVADYKACLSSEDFEEKCKDADQLRSEEKKARTNARSSLKSYAESILKALDDRSSSKRMPEETSMKARSQCNSVLKWLLQHPSAEKDLVLKKLKDLETAFGLVIDLPKPK